MKNHIRKYIGSDMYILRGINSSESKIKKSQFRTNKIPAHLAQKVLDFSPITKHTLSLIGEIVK